MYEGGLDRAHEIVDEAGRDAAGFEAAYYQDVVIAETEAEAIEQAREFLNRYYPSWGELSDEDIRNEGVRPAVSRRGASHELCRCRRGTIRHAIHRTRPTQATTAVCRACRLRVRRWFSSSSDRDRVVTCVVYIVPREMGDMVVTIDNIETVAVVGAGQMGRGIGAVAALAGTKPTSPTSTSRNSRKPKKRSNGPTGRPSRMRPRPSGKRRRRLRRSR